MGKFDDDLHLVSSADFVPTTVNALLKQVGLTDAPRGKQAKAISTWLQSHQPSPMMEYSIRHRGFAALLNPRIAV